MDSQDQIIQKLATIDRDLRSLRYTFGLVLIVLAVLLAVAAPVVVKLLWSKEPTPVLEAPSATFPAALSGKASTTTPLAL